MPIRLTLFIPTYNRCQKLRNCLTIIAREMAGHEQQVLVMVSNNCSTDDTRSYLDSLDYPWLKIQHNASNIGAHANIQQCFSLPFQSEFVWAIGDDDYLVPGALGGLLTLIAQYPQADYIFCNTKAFPTEQGAAIMQQYLEHGTVDGGEVKSRKYVGTAMIGFTQLIDPAIADTLLGELMCNCFRQSAVRFQDEGVIWDGSRIDWANADLDTVGKLHQSHNLPFLQSFTAQTPVLYCDAVRTFNFWGSAEWLGNYDYVFPVIILFLIKQYRLRGFIDQERQAELLTYFFRVMNNSLIRQADGTSQARPFSVSIKSEMFDFMCRNLARPVPKSP